MSQRVTGERGKPLRKGNDWFVGKASQHRMFERIELVF